jgi:DeoR/GlpR family transcriptional regulator of sugar metabolism
MAKKTFTHRELCYKAARYLKNKSLLPFHKCQYVFCELERYGECPDALGFASGSGTQLIEVKTSRSDFLSDKKNITVITNGIPLAALLVQKGIKTYCTGGEIFQNSLAHFGSFAEEFIRKFNIDTMFFSCHGVNEIGMLTDPSLPETQIRRVAINQSKKTVFLCDKSKFSLSTPYNLMPINDVNFIVTDYADITHYLIKDGKNKIIIVK